MTISLPADVEAFVANEVAAGVYASQSDLIVAAVQLLRRHQADYDGLKADIAEGMEGDVMPAEEVFAQLRAKYPAESGTTLS